MNLEIVPEGILGPLEPGCGLTTGGNGSGMANPFPFSIIKTMGASESVWLAPDGEWGSKEQARTFESHDEARTIQTSLGGSKSGIFVWSPSRSERA